MSTAQTSSHAASVVSVLIVGLAFIIPAESTNPGYYAKHLVLQSGLAVLAFLAFRCGLPLPRPRLFIPVVLLLLLHILAVTQSVNRVESVFTILHRIAICTSTLVIAATLHRESIARVTRLLAVTSSIVALIGIGQYLGLADLLAIPSSGMPSSTLGYRNFAAAFTIAVIPFVLAGLLGASTSLQHTLWSIALALNATFLVATRTRAAWIACILSLAVVAVCVVVKSRAEGHRIRLPNWRRPVGVAAACGVIAILFSSLIPPKMGGLGYDRNRQEKTSIGTTISTTLEAGSDKDRLRMWSNTLGMMGESFILGVGPGNWQFVYPRYDRGEVAWKGGTPRRPHNDYLWIASETGVVGALLSVLILVWLVYAARASLNAGRDRTAFLHTIGASGSLIAICVHAAFSFPLERIPVMFIASFAVAILIGGVKRRPLPATRLVWMLTIALHLTGAAMVWRAVSFDQHAYQQSIAGGSNAWDRVRVEGELALRSGVIDPQVLMLRGLAHHVSGDYRSAIEDQERCLEYHPYFVNAINNLGMSLNAAGQYHEAARVLAQIKPLNPDHFEQHLNLYQAFAGMGALPEADEQLSIALTRSKDLRGTAFNLAGYHEARSELDLAARVVRAAMNRQPEDFQLVYRLGVIEQKAGKLDSAKERFLEVARKGPTYAPVHYNLGEVYLAQNDTLAALASYNTFLKLWKGNKGAADAVRKRIEALR